MNAPRTVRNVLLLVVLLGVAAIGYWKYDRPAPGAAEYRSSPVVCGDIRQIVTASGQVEPVINVQVGSQISGTIERIFVDYNSLVTNGQVLAQIDPAIYRTALKQAQGELANAVASLELARINARRAEDLHRNQLIAASDYDQAVANLHQAEAVAQIRDAMVDKARVDLERTTITSPIDGIVISRDVEVGQTVAASFNTPKLFVIANDLSKMRIHADVSEADIGGVQRGQPVEFLVDAFPNRKFSGSVEQVRNAAQTNQNVITYTTVIDVANPEARLKPGMTANVSITLAERTNVLKLPVGALRFRPPEAANSAGTPAPGGGLAQAQAAGPGPGRTRPPAVSRSDAGEERTVYRLTGASPGSPGTPTPVTITTGISDGAFVEVREGLSEGDEVVTGSLAVTVPASTAATGQNNPFAPPRPPRR